MKVERLIETASSAYPDGLVETAFETGGDVGDSIAEFIASEINETFEEESTDLEQVQTAIEKLETAWNELGDVIKALKSLETELYNSEEKPRA